MQLLSCNFEPASWLIFSSNVYEPVIYYSHLGPLIASLLLGIFVLLNNRRSLSNWVFFSLAILFSTWVYFDLVLWATEKAEYSMFFWSALIHIELLIFATCLYLVLLFANHQEDISLTKKLSIGVFFVPLILFAHTTYNLFGFDMTNCDRAAIEGPLWQYVYLVEVLFILWAALSVTAGFRNARDRQERNQLLFIGLGAVLFMLAFTAGNITLIFELDWSLEQYKLFGMPIFLAFLTYSIVKFKTFNVKLIATQALVAGIAVLIGARLFYSTTTAGTILSAVTLVGFLISGVFLIRSVKREIEQRERIEKLAGELKNTNERQEVLMHFIGHEVKGTLAKDAGVFASISEGDLGPVPETVKTFVERALVESRTGASSVENILKASNLKKGSVTYTKEPFDLKTLIVDAVEKAKSIAEKKGLTLSFTVDESSYQMTGDKAQISDHVLRNIIDNSINYTSSGAITISLKKENGKFVLAVKDTGIGITEEDKKRLFTEGGHGKDSQKVNVHSTGYGLYIAKNIVLAHGGNIRAESEGAGKGSTFIVEFSIGA